MVGMWNDSTMNSTQAHKMNIVIPLEMQKGQADFLQAPAYDEGNDRFMLPNNYETLRQISSYD